MSSLIIGCVDRDFLDEEIKDRVLADNLYQNRTGFEAGLNGLYATLLAEHIGKNAARPLYITMKQGMDNMFAPLWGKDNTMPQLLNDTNNSEVQIFYATWSWLYKVINLTNTIITRAEDEEVDWEAGSNQESNIAIKNGVIAEARCVRAWAYRHLTNLWGDVPLMTEESTSSNIERGITRTDFKVVENLMEEDLLFAIQNLPNVPVRPGKVSKAVAQHYLAELYLKQGNYESAEQMASAVINSGDYELVTSRYGVKAGEPGTPFSDIFIEGNVARSKGNTEVLWSWHREYEVIGGENPSITTRWTVWPYDRYFYDDVSHKKLKVTADRGGRGLCAMAMTKFALGLYEEGDDRNGPSAMRRYFILREGDGINPDYHQIGDTIHIDISDITEHFTLKAMWPSPIKNEWALEDNPRSGYQYNDNNYIRLAETYFLLAEAQIKLGKVNEAAESINVVRRRSNVSDITGADVDIDFLLDERSRELVYEEHRKYVLVRNNKYIERVKLYNPMAAPNVTERDRLWPIPQPELDLSPETMIQNPGY